MQDSAGAGGTFARRIVLAAVIAALSFPRLVAQCPINDGFLPTSCCTPVSGNLPVFPSIALSGLGACFNDCALELQYQTSITIGASHVLSDQWVFAVTLNSTNAAFSIADQAPVETLVGKYAGMWVELPPGGGQIQVWRFLVNGDFKIPYFSDAAPGCPIPISAAPPFDLPVHFVGHLDYARDCATGTWQCAYSLTHFGPAESHAPWSRRPLAAAAGWPSRTYHFVGPANFSFGPGVPPSGVIVAPSAGRTAIGLSDPTAPYTSFGLHSAVWPVSTLSTVNTDCACSSSGSGALPSRYHHQTVGTIEACVPPSGPSACILANYPTGLPNLPTGLRALVVGSWLPVSGSSYPGQKCLSVYLGLLSAKDPCHPQLPSHLHPVTGIGTTGGNPVALFWNTTSPPWPYVGTYAFVDLQDMLVPTQFGFVPGFGSVFLSERVWRFVMGDPAPTPPPPPPPPPGGG